MARPSAAPECAPPPGQQPCPGGEAGAIVAHRLLIFPVALRDLRFQFRSRQNVPATLATAMEVEVPVAEWA